MGLSEKKTRQPRRSRRQQMDDARLPASHDVALVFDEAAHAAVFALHAAGQLLVRRTTVASLREQLAAAFSAAHVTPADTATLRAQFLTCVPQFTEEASELRLAVESLPASPDDLCLALAEAVQQNLVGDDQQPVFPEPARDPGYVWDVARTPSGQLTMTSAARAALDDVAARIAEDALDIGDEADDEDLYLDFRCETYVRAVLRAHLATLTPGDLPDDPGLVSALVVFTARGASVGMWSPERGLFKEDAEPFHAGEGFDDRSVMEHSVAHALENLALRLSPTSLKEYGFKGVHRVWWASSVQLRPQVLSQMALFETDYTSRFTVFNQSAQIRTGALTEPLEEITARGLLMSSDPEQAAVLPPVNLAHGVVERAAEVTEERESRARIEHLTRRRRIQIAACAPLIVVLGLLCGGYLLTLLSSYMLDNALARETAEKERLTPVAERRRAANESLKWVSAYLAQVTELRRRQPASLSLLAALDERYPVAEDNSFTVKSLQAGSDGSIILQGLTKRDDAISALLTRLEYSPTDPQGRKLFEHAVMELRKPQVGGINLPSLPGGQNQLAPLTSVQSQRPDVSAWTVRAIYTPLQRESVLTPKAPPAPAGGPRPATTNPPAPGQAAQPPVPLPNPPK